VIAVASIAHINLEHASIVKFLVINLIAMLVYDNWSGLNVFDRWLTFEDPILFKNWVVFCVHVK
jgi:hypothetical protein